MKQITVVLAIFSCILCFAACAPKENQGEQATPTPTEQVQGDQNTEGNLTTDDNGNTENTQDTAVQTAVPENSEEGGSDLEEDILEGGDNSDSSVTSTPVNTSAPQTTTSGTQATPENDAAATAAPTESVISLPMDFF